MGCKVKACAECRQNCLLIHGKKKDPSPIVTSFFKVMIGDQFSKVLFLPPKFARTVSALVDQEFHLEDSSGRQWRVTLSNLNGSFAFQQGWHAFSLDHGLEAGMFVLFHYIMGSHFVVKIYSRNGCEKLDFSEDNSNEKKRSRTDRNSIAKDGPCHSIDKGSMNKQSSSISVVSGSDIEIIQSQCDVNDVEKVPKATENTSNNENSNGRPQPVSQAEYIEEPYYMIDRDFGYKQGDDRSSLFDLSNFEMRKDKSGVDGTDKIVAGDERSYHADMSPRSRTEARVVDRDPVAEEVASRVAPSDASDIEMIEKNNDSEMMEKLRSMSEKDSCNGKTSGHLSSEKYSCNGKTSRKLLTTSAVKSGKNGKDNLDMSNKAIKKCQLVVERSNTHSRDDRVVLSQKEHTPPISDSQSVQQKSTGMTEFCEFPVTIGTQHCQSGEKMKVVKKEQVEMIQEIRGKESKVSKEEHGQCSNLTVKDNGGFKVVKTEPVDSVALSSSDAANFFCSVVTDGQSFLELPTCLPSFSYKGRSKMERKVVFLQDPVMRLWPVLYHERYDFKALTSGWEAFSKANNIQPGDECVFGVENIPEGIYGVRIVRR